MAKKFDQELDCSGQSCPMPILMTNNAVKGMKVGQVLKMVSTDPGSVPDMEAWSKKVGHELMEHEEEGGKHVFYVKKAK